MDTHVEAVESVASLRIADALRRAILAGRYAPGERMRQEVIAEEFGSSRLPVREALRILQSDGLVSIVANSGAWVSKLDAKECSESYEIRERIEPLLLRESMPLLSEDDVATMRRLAEQMHDGADVETFLRLDREFHLMSYAKAETVHAVVTRRAAVEHDAALPPRLHGAGLGPRHVARGRALRALPARRGDRAG